MTKNVEGLLLPIVEYHLTKILDFAPYDKFEAVTNAEEFKNLIKKDPAFSPFCLHNDKYVIARIGGNLITSIHRKLGDLYEDIILELLTIKYGFSRDYLKFSLNIVIDGKEQERTTDGRLILADIKDKDLKGNVKNLMVGDYAGLAMEVRSCYQIGDSKRIQADEHMANALKAINIEPKLVIFCNTSLISPVKRLSHHWTLYQGEEAFNYIHNLTSFNLYKFLMDNQATIKPIMDKVFASL